MNKRQYKKARKKINRICLLDELVLITYDKEDYQNFLMDIDDYCYKHHRYKHYRDKNEPLVDLQYRPPVGKAASRQLKKILNNCMSYSHTMKQ